MHESINLSLNESVYELEKYDTYKECRNKSSKSTELLENPI
jgi:hypothetical protein